MTKKNFATPEFPYEGTLASFATAQGVYSSAPVKISRLTRRLIWDDVCFLRLIEKYDFSRLESNFEKL